MAACLKPGGWRKELTPLMEERHGLITPLNGLKVC